MCFMCYHKNDVNHLESQDWDLPKTILETISLVYMSVLCICVAKPLVYKSNPIYGVTSRKISPFSIERQMTCQCKCVMISGYEQHQNDKPECHKSPPNLIWASTTQFS